MDLTSTCTCMKNFVGLWWTVFSKFNFEFFQNFAFSFLKYISSFFNQDRVYFDAHYENLFFISIFTWVQNFTMVQKHQKPKITAQNHDIRGTKFCIFGHLRTFWLATAKRLELVAQNFAHSLPSTRAIFLQNFSLYLKCWEGFLA